MLTVQVFCANCLFTESTCMCSCRGSANRKDADTRRQRYLKSSIGCVSLDESFGWELRRHAGVSPSLPGC